jgi:hypothetical protein
MWLATNIGFFSIVKKDGKGTLTVRSRVLRDLQQFKERLLISKKPKIIVSDDSDYRYRLIASKLVVEMTVAVLVAHIDYDNFKNEVRRTQGSHRAHIYGEVWEALYQLQLQEQEAHLD